MASHIRIHFDKDASYKRILCVCFNKSNNCLWCVLTIFLCHLQSLETVCTLDLHDIDPAPVGN